MKKLLKYCTNCIIPETRPQVNFDEEVGLQFLSMNWKEYTQNKANSADVKSRAAELATLEGKDMNLDEVNQELRELNEPVPKPLRLPTQEEVDEIEIYLEVELADESDSGLRITLYIFRHRAVVSERLWEQVEIHAIWQPADIAPETEPVFSEDRWGGKNKVGSAQEVFFIMPNLFFRLRIPERFVMIIVVYAIYSCSACKLVIDETLNGVETPYNRILQACLESS